MKTSAAILIGLIIGLSYSTAKAQVQYEDWHQLFTNNNTELVGQYRRGFFLDTNLHVNTEVIQIKNTCPLPLEIEFFWVDDQNVKRKEGEARVMPNQTVSRSHADHIPDDKWVPGGDILTGNWTLRVVPILK
jgi:hypothetical protein